MLSTHSLSHGTQHPGVAQPVFLLGDATRTEDRQGGDGAETGGSFVLDDAPGVGLRASEKAGNMPYANLVEENSFTLFIGPRSV
ncbi:MAG: hypothetical protein WB919_05750 [Candidatus Sulfotelmatobacter sp.]